MTIKQERHLRCYLITLSMILPVYLAAQVKSNETIIDLGSRLEIFVDSFLIESLENLDLRMHVPEDRGPVLWFDKPWEGMFSTYTSILKDGDLYRLYYRGVPSVGADGSQAEVTCYAESEDGKLWVKPELGIFEIERSLKNNVILARAAPVTHNFSPFIDANPALKDKYKFKALGGTEKGLIPYGSTDGMHWVRMNEDPVVTGGAFDSQNVAFWSESEESYLCYLRKWIEVDGTAVRSVARSMSDDFMSWTVPVNMDFGNRPMEELYTNQTSPYYRATHIYIAIAARFFPGKQVITGQQAKKLNVNPLYYHDCSDAVLLSSRGGNQYQRTFMEGFLRPGPGLSNWVSRTNYPALNVVPTGEYEMSFYVNQDYAQHTAHLRRYSMRIDGFASIHAGYDPGELITKPFTFSGKNLLINFSTSAGGQIFFEITSQDGQAVKNFSYEDCLPLIGNEIERQVEWKTGSDLSELNGKPVRLRVRLKDADLYSIKFE